MPQIIKSGRFQKWLPIHSLRKLTRYDSAVDLLLSTTTILPTRYKPVLYTLHPSFGIHFFICTKIFGGFFYYFCNAS